MTRNSSFLMTLFVLTLTFSSISASIVIDNMNAVSLIAYAKKSSSSDGGGDNNGGSKDSGGSGTNDNSEPKPLGDKEKATAAPGPSNPPQACFPACPSGGGNPTPATPVPSTPVPNGLCLQNDMCPPNHPTPTPRPVCIPIGHTKCGPHDVTCDPHSVDGCAMCQITHSIGCIPPDDVTTNTILEHETNIPQAPLATTPGLTSAQAASLSARIAQLQSLMSKPYGTECKSQIQTLLDVTQQAVDAQNGFIADHMPTLQQGIPACYGSIAEQITETS
jgi:hypothetical protein